MSVPVPIPYGTTYTAFAEGTTWKFLDCEHCRTVFAYPMYRSAEGQGLSVLFLDNEGARELAVAVAQRRLQHKLKKGFDMVPCPHCGKYQEFMLRTIRWQRWEQRLILGILLILLGAISFGAGFLFSISSSYRLNPDVPVMMRNCYIAVAGFIGLGLSWLAFRAIQCCHYDPNNSREHSDRMGLAASRSISGEAIQRLLIDMVAKHANRTDPPA
ncbi:MAG: hypothetical protein HY289_14950 [Planctomycetes bacterium]|nr:hypothetical protein [Planctomycetota bacterium]